MSSTHEVREPSTVPEVLTDEHHEAIMASWTLPAYQREITRVVEAEHSRGSRRAFYTGLIVGAICLAIGAGVGYWAGAEQASTQALAPIVVSQTVPTVPGYSVTHDSRILEPVDYSTTHDSRIVEQGFDLASATHDSRILEPVDYSAIHDSRIPE